MIAGIGLGGLVPTANALAAELIQPKWRGPVATMMMSGVPIGGSIAALLAIPVIPRFGWQPMFLFAVLPLIVLVPVAMRTLPARTFGQVNHSRSRGFGALLGPQFRTISILFALATMFTLLAWYGLGTWLPKLMQGEGTDLGSALTFALALNLGAVAGSFVTAWGAVRFGTIPTSIVAAAVAGGALAGVARRPAGGAGVRDLRAGRCRHAWDAVPDHRRGRVALPRRVARYRAGLGAGRGPDRRGVRTADRRVAAGGRVWVPGRTSCCSPSARWLRRCCSPSSGGSARHRSKHLAQPCLAH